MRVIFQHQEPRYQLIVTRSPDTMNTDSHVCGYFDKIAIHRIRTDATNYDSEII